MPDPAHALLRGNRPWSGFPQVKITGNFFPVSITSCGCSAVSHWVIAHLIARESDLK
jgi:hypothetical protein